ncbi:hypothetical protein YC2023_016765 [Brassica napus]
MSLGASANRPNDLLKSLHGGRYDTWTGFRMFDSSSRSDHTMSIGMHQHTSQAAGQSEQPPFSGSHSEDAATNVMEVDKQHHPALEKRRRSANAVKFGSVASRCSHQTINFTQASFLSNLRLRHIAKDNRPTQFGNIN